MDCRARVSLLVVAAAIAGTVAVGGPARAEAPELVIDAKAWRLVGSQSGPVNYYSTMTDDGRTFVHGRYVPPMKTAVLGYQIADEDRQRAKRLRWTWRARTLPAGGNECVADKRDSAAVVYVTWKRGLRYYTLKYAWSAVGTKGNVCDSKRNAFVAQDSVIVESGGPLDVWKSMDVDLAQHFRHHFANDDPNAALPDLVGLGIMTDGDQTNSESAADYGTFVLVR